MTHIQVVQKSIPSDVIKYIQDNNHKLSTDVSNYAKGRSRAWIGCEAPLSDKYNFRSCPFGYESTLWLWLMDFSVSELGFYPECGLLHIGGADCSDPTDTPINGPGGECGIQEHRDAGYADYRAVGINLIGEATFGYIEEYPHIDQWTRDKNSSPKIQYVKMIPGTCVIFNCKNPHFAEVGPNRICINAWRISDKRREDFILYKESL